MARNEARGINPSLFDRNWSRVSGSWQGLARNAQMVRAARGYSPAIFKPIAKGGCHTGAQLKAQLTYLTTKSSHILDSRGTHDGKKTLSEAEITRVVRRFENQWGERQSPKLGHTSHLLMAFPIGTKGAEVRAITEAVCERFFQGDGAQFDYIAAIHEDRAHPHTHVVLNRRSKDGEMFYLGKDHHFNYDAFRLAMVEAAQVHGIRLEATRRLDRGVTTYRAEIDEIFKARSEGRDPVERQRTGSDLAMALQAVSRNALTYRGLAAEASRSSFDDVADALERASAVLAAGEQIQKDGVIYMSDDDAAFDTLITEFSQNIRQIETAIGRAPASERPEIERKLTDVLASVAHLNPLGDRSAALIDAPSRDGLYAHQNTRDDQRERLEDDGLRTRLADVLKGSGIEADAVVARMREGANNAALERQWLSQDLNAIATAGDLDLEKPEDREEALDRLEAIHARLGDVLSEAAILRDVDDPEVMDAEAARSANIVVGEGPGPRFAMRHAGHDPHGVAEATPSIAAFLRRNTTDEAATGSEASRQTLAQEIDRELGSEERESLRAGNAEALSKFTEDPIERLELAKAYLQSSAVTAHSAAIERVLDALAEKQVEEQRARHAATHADKGITHG